MIDFIGLKLPIPLTETLELDAFDWHQRASPYLIGAQIRIGTLKVAFARYTRLGGTNPPVKELLNGILCDVDPLHLLAVGLALKDLSSLKKNKKKRAKAEEDAMWRRALD